MATKHQERGKGQGELVELKFYFKAYQEGFIASKPFGDNARYDFVVDYKGRLCRIQVKSTNNVNQRNRYRFMTGYGHKNKTCYTKEDIDCLVGYIISEDIWYIFPVEYLENRPTLSVYPYNKDHETNLFRENWDLLKHPVLRMRMVKEMQGGK